MIKRNYYKVVRIFPDPSSYFYIKNETMSEDDLSSKGSWLNTVNLEYSFDKVNWERITDGNYHRIKLPADGYMYFRNTSGTFTTSNYQYVFYPRVDISLGGDIRTLFNYTDVESVTKIPDYGFSNVFSMQDNTKITDISNLSFRGITEIGNYGLDSAFTYQNITKGVDLRDVTTLGERALKNLYTGNANLTEVYAPNVSTWDTSKTGNWLYNVSSSGIIYKPTNLTIPTNTDGIPSGWTTQDYPEE